MALVLSPATIGGRWLYRADAQNFVIALNIPAVHRAIPQKHLADAVERSADVTACYRLREVGQKQISSSGILYLEDKAARCRLLVHVKAFQVVCVSNADIFHSAHLSALSVAVHHGDVKQIQTEDHEDKGFHGYASSIFTDITR